jgi:hypothetical protein
MSDWVQDLDVNFIFAFLFSMAVSVFCLGTFFVISHVIRSLIIEHFKIKGKPSKRLSYIILSLHKLFFILGFTGCMWILVHLVPIFYSVLNKFSVHSSLFVL